MSTNIRYHIAIIGLGGMGDWHRNEIETIDGLELAGIYDIDEKRQDYARQQNVFVYNSAEDLLSDSKVDLVLIATPNDLHKPLAIQALAAGKNVVCEKPATLTSADLQEMIDASKRYGKLLTIHQNRRWDEDFLTIKKVMEEGKLGTIHRIESRVHGSRGIPGDWRQEKERGGGMVLDWGVHLLDQVLLMKKGIPLSRVYASLTHVTNQLVDDGFTTLLTFADGQEIFVEVGTSNFINLPRWYVTGENGTAIIKDWDLSGEVILTAGKDEKDVVPVRTAAGLTKTMAPRRDDTIHKEELPIVKSDVRDFYRNVMNVLDGKEASLIKLDEVMDVFRLMETIFESAEKGEVIHYESN